MRSGLPIDEALPPLLAALASGRNAVLVAPPGAGKSTVVPLALLDEPWARGQKIVLLEPRRLAARAVATRMASSLGERPGGTVGYRMRLETRVSAETRLEVVTEGVLTRMLQSDPALDGVAAVIFDEFHEQSLNADVGLALARDAQRHLSPELRLLAMSATLDGAAVARLLGGAPVIEHAARGHAVETHYVGKGLPALPGQLGPGDEPPEAVVARVVRRALAEVPGDLLVFLPGAGEIRRSGTRRCTFGRVPTCSRGPSRQVRCGPRPPRASSPRTRGRARSDRARSANDTTRRRAPGPGAIPRGGRRRPNPRRRPVTR